MTLNQLYYIVAVDNFRHFNTAAESCFVTQPTLSMQIQKLEEELGVQIFDRGKQPVVPTEIGKKILVQARKIIQEAERLQNIIDNETGAFTGSLKIGIIPTIAPYLIPLFLQNFVSKYPKVELIIDEITTAEIIKALHKDLIDVGILALPVNSADIVERPLYYEPFIVYVSEEHPLYNKRKVNVDDLSRNDLLLLKEGHCLREHTLQICKKNDREWKENDRRILFESGNLDTLKRLVEQNFGFTLLPSMAMKNFNEDELALCREFDSPVPRREIGLVYSKVLAKKHLVDALEDEILNAVPKHLLTFEDSFIVH